MVIKEALITLVMGVILNLTCPNYSRAQSLPAEHAEIEAATQKFFDLYQKKDLQGLMAMWEPNTPEAPRFKDQMEHLFSREEYKFGDWEHSRYLQGNTAWVRVAVDLTIYDSIVEHQLTYDTGTQSFAKKDTVVGRKERTHTRLIRNLVLVKSDNWKVVHYAPAVEEIASALFYNIQLSEDMIANECRLASDKDHAWSTDAVINGLIALAASETTSDGYKRARRMYEAARRIAEAAGWRAKLADCIFGLANVDYNEHQYRNAEQNYRNALASFRAEKFEGRSMEVMYYLARCLVATNRFTEALHCLYEARHISENPRDKTWPATDWVPFLQSYIGAICLRTSPQNALEPCLSAVNLYRKSHADILLTNAKMRLAHAYLLQDYYRLALPLYLSSRHEFGERNDAIGEASSLLGIGTTLCGQGDAEDALESLNAALNLFPSTDIAGRGQTLIALSIAYRILSSRHEYDVNPSLRRKYRSLASTTAQQAIDLMLRDKNVSQCIIAYTCLESVGGFTNNTLIKYADKVMSLGKIPGGVLLPEGGERFYLASKLVLLPATSSDTLDSSSLSHALQFHRWALNWSKTNGSPLFIAAAKLNVANILSQSAKYGDAVSLAKRALDYPTGVDSSELRLQSLIIEGHAHEGLDEQRDAIACFEGAVRINEILRGRIANPDEEGQHYLEDKSRLYERLVNLSILRNEQAKALEYSERIKGRLLLSALRGSFERTDVTRYFGLDGKFEEMISIKQIDGLLNADTGIMEFCVTDNQTFIFVITSGDRPGVRADIQIFTAHIPRRILQEHALTLNDYASKDNGAFELSTLPRDLFGLLLEKAVRGPLRRKKSLIIVPDGPLWLVPFQALISSQGQSKVPKYLWDDYAISYGYSLTWLREQRNEWKAHLRAPLTFMSFANPSPSALIADTNHRPMILRNGSSADDTAGNASRMNRPELSDHFSSFGSRAFAYQDATKERFQREAWRARILYLPLHGVLNDQQPMDSFVRLTPVDALAGHLTARDISRLHLNAEIVILAACETARGYAAPGEGLIGLTWACSRAGAHTTIGTQWAVPVPQTDMLMTEFNRILRDELKKRKPEITKAQALQKAAHYLMTAKDGGGRRSPRYWAGVIIIGDAGLLQNAGGATAQSTKAKHPLKEVRLTSDPGIALETNIKVQLAGGHKFDSEAQAHSGDAVNFCLYLGNTGYKTGLDPRLTMHLDPKLSYVPGTSTLSLKQNNLNWCMKIPDKLIEFQRGEITWALKKMLPRADSSIYLIFQARVAKANKFVDTFGIKTTLHNFAQCSFLGCSARTNDAPVVVSPAFLPSEPEYSVRFEATNYDLKDPRTKQPDQFKDGKAAPASPGDLIWFRVTLVNLKDKPGKHLKLKVDLPNYIQYTGNLQMFDLRHHGEAIAGDAIVKQGLDLSDLSVGTLGYRSLRFQCRIGPSIPYPAFEVQIPVELWATDRPDNKLLSFGEILRGELPGKDNRWQDKASLFISAVRGLHILTSFRRQGEMAWQYGSIGPAAQGTEIEYRIVLQNNSAKIIRNVLVRAALPRFLSYINDTLTQDDAILPKSSQQAFLGQGMLVTDMVPGWCQQYTFKIRIDNEPILGELVVNQLVEVTAQNVKLVENSCPMVPVRY